MVIIMVSRDTSRKPTARRIAIIGALLVALICLGCLIWRFVGTDRGQVGTTIGDYEGLTREEIIEELNRSARENMMTISVAPNATIRADGTVRVNVINVSENRFAQRFSIIQNDEVLYTSDQLNPGRKIETCHVNGLEPGSASIEIQAVDQETGEDHGSPMRVNIAVNEASAS